MAATEIVTSQVREGWGTGETDHRAKSRSKQYLTEFGGDSLTAGFSKDLLQFYGKANAEDKRRCLELLTSLSIGEELTKHAAAKKPARPKGPKLQRPKTAMASLGRSGAPQVKRTMTTYRRDFPGVIAPPAPQARPKSTDGLYKASYELNGPVGTPTYNKEFYNKGYCRPQLIRSGTSSGDRRNNPHPFESFMVWRFPKHVPKDQQIYPGEITDQMMEEVLRDKCKSTYQNDYLGVPQGYQMQSAFENYVDWREKVPFSLASTMRFSYQFPKQQDLLRGNNSRYGCNKDKHLKASGIVPLSSTHQKHLRRHTTYDRFFNKPFRPGMVEVSKALDAGKLDEYLQLASEKERDVLQKMLESMAKCEQPRPPSASGSRPKSATSTRPANLSWISNWNGPA
ncbi:testis-expressed protein 26-like [Acanthaster planci]|uniref:Testis-expressed protein 26-like n=1 Tax=Acanthaster planci TaxID=133434 RepID=A0A8B7XZ05_ACAPL|nr:testis-expressed protein 26-like [Acanthaster planci]